MAHFYGTLQGSRGEASRLGGKASGIQTIAAGWGGAINTRVWHDERDGVDRFRVELTPWQSSGGESKVLAEGVLDAHGTVKVQNHGGHRVEVIV